MKKITLLLNVCSLVLSYPSFLLCAEAADGPMIVSLTRDPSPLKDLPANISVITAADIKQMNAKTVADVLGFTPSANVQNTGSLGAFTTVRLRGVPNSNQVQILIDDQPVGGVFNQEVDLSLLPVHNIERIEIVRGGASVLYGANVIGGVINIITKKPTEDGGSVSVGAETGSFDTQATRAEFQGKSKGWNGILSGQAYTSDGFQVNSDAKDTAISGSAGYTFSNAVQVQADLGVTNHETGDPQGTTVPVEEWDGHKERAAFDENSRVEQDRTEGRLKFGIPAGGSYINSLFYGSRHDYLTRPAKGAPANYEKKETVVGNDTRVQLPHRWTVGGAFERDERDDGDQDPHHLVNVAGYAQKDFLFDNIRLIPAVRVDDNSAYGTVVNPRLSGVMKLTEPVSFSFNMARGFRAPNFLELYYASPWFNGNPNLEPEKARSFDLGLEIRPAKNQTLKLTDYYLAVDNLIKPTATSYENVPQAVLTGIEAEWSGTTFLTKSVRLGHGLNYTYQEARGNSLTSPEFVPLRLTSKHLASGLITCGFKEWSLANTVRYQSEQYKSDNRQGPRMPASVVWDARLAWAIPAFEVYAGINNITNRHYADAFSFSGLYPQPDRNYYAGVNLKIGYKAQKTME